MATPRARLPTLLLAAALLAAACGDDGASDADPAPDGEATTSAPATTAPSTTAPGTTEAPDDPVGTTTTTVPAAPTIEALDPAAIPDLVVRWGEGTDPALDLAREIIGFPLDVPPPSDGGAYGVRVELSAQEADAPWFWDWDYETIAAEPIGDIDIALDDNGPGSVALREYGDEVMAELGWSYSNSTGSDPSSGAGGPQSINHVYVHDIGTIPLGRVDATTSPLFLWADEDIDFREGPDVGGYRIDVSLDVPAGAPVVPLLQTFVDTVPVPDGGRLVDGSLRSLDRLPDSFEADEGLRYLEVDLVYLLEPGTAETAQELYATGLDGTILQPAEESFFEPGFYQPARPLEGDRWTQPVLFLERYEGSIEVEERDAELRARFRLRLEPNRELLQPIEE